MSMSGRLLLRCGRLFHARTTVANTRARFDNLAREAQIVVQGRECDSLQAHDYYLGYAHQILRVLFEHVDERTTGQT